MKTTIHILWGEEAVRRYRLNIIDNTVRLAHAAYDFFDAREAQGFLRGVTAARQSHEFAVITSIPDVNRLGPPLRERLFAAVREGDVRTVEALLDIGVNPNGLDGNGLAPLHWAAREGEPKIAELLVSAGADIDAVAPHTKQTALIMACDTARPGCADVAQVLIERGANVNAADGLGNGAMHYAARNAEHLVVEALVGARADPSARNNDGHMPHDFIGLFDVADDDRSKAVNVGGAAGWVDASNRAEVAELLARARADAAAREKASSDAMRKPKLRPTPYNT